VVIDITGYSELLPELLLLISTAILVAVDPQPTPQFALGVIMLPKLSFTGGRGALPEEVLARFGVPPTLALLPTFLFSRHILSQPRPLQDVLRSNRHPSCSEQSLVQTRLGIVGELGHGGIHGFHAVLRPPVAQSVQECAGVTVV
jgi:hypothetical protein